jgi:hypothetical protein
LRAFVTTTVTVDALSDVFGLSFVGVLCASAGAAIKPPHSVAASAKARVRLVMIFLRRSCANLRLRRWRENGEDKAKTLATLAAS